MIITDYHLGKPLAPTAMQRGRVQAPHSSFFLELCLPKSYWHQFQTDQEVVEAVLPLSQTRSPSARGAAHRPLKSLTTLDWHKQDRSLPLRAR
jgi:hypothetical protein